MKTIYYKLLACLLICGFSMLNITTSNAQCSWSGTIDYTAAAHGLGNSITSGSIRDSVIGVDRLGNRFLFDSSQTAINSFATFPTGTDREVFPRVDPSHE